VLGSLGITSGVLGGIMQPTVDGARAWVADVNARGGLAGHKVRLVVGDDAGDPNKSLSLAKKMVDDDHVVSFYAEHGPSTMQAVYPFLEQKKIPVIGTCNCTVESAHSPMVFEIGHGGDSGVSYGHAAGLLALSDKRKISILYCGEVPTCSGVKNHIHEFAGATGLTIVHEAQTTISQPDYTAEVLAARRAGAEALIVVLDNASVIRVARSAHRQDYNPVISGQFSAHNQSFLDVGGADVEGIVLGAGYPHWTSPKLADFIAALGRAIPGAKPSSFTIGSWAAGKFMEAFAATLPDKPTSADFLKGVYSLKAETLGGLVPPLTFVEGKTSDGTDMCVIPVRVVSGKFVAPDGDNFSCAPGWKPASK